MLQEKLPPTIAGSSPVANGVALTRDPLGFFKRLAGEAGDFACYELSDRLVYFVNDPRLVRQVIATQHECFTKWAFNDSFDLIFGTGLIGSQGELHRVMRKEAQPSLQSRRFPQYVDAIVNQAARQCAAWSAGELDLSHEMSLLTLEVIGRTLFGVSLGQRAARIATLTGKLLRLNTKLGGASDDARAFALANAELTVIAQEIIEESRLASPNESLLTSLIRAEQNRLISEEQLCQEVRTFLLAGHVTTAQTIACAFWLLARHSEWQVKLCAEIDAVLGDGLATLAHLSQLCLCRMIILEVLRLYPPVWVFGRHALCQVSLDGYTIAAGRDLVIVSWLLHRKENFFPQPELFDPGRWKNDALSRLPQCVYLPFSIGQRSCLGEHFAMMQSVLVLASVAQHWRFAELPGRPDPGWSAQLLYWPRRGIRLQVEPRY